MCSIAALTLSDHSDLVMARDHSDVGVGTFVFVWPLRSITFVRVDIFCYATLLNVVLDSVIQLFL